MDHLLVSTTLESNITKSIIEEVSFAYSSQLIHNNWTSACVNLRANIDTLGLTNIIAFISILTAIPVQICSHCESPCRHFSTLIINLEEHKISLGLNLTYRITYELDQLNINGPYEKRVENSLIDPIKVYLHSSASQIYTWENSSFICGRRGALLNILGDVYQNPIHVISPLKTKWRKRRPRKELKQKNECFIANRYFVGSKEWVFQSVVLKS